MGKKKPLRSKPGSKARAPSSAKSCGRCGKSLDRKTRGNSCSSCWLEEQAAVAAPQARELGLPELTGTSKQIQYAIVLRQKHVAAELARLLDESGRQSFLAGVSARTEAKWWIERGPSSTRSRVDPGAVAGAVVQFDGGCTKNPGGVGTFGALLRLDGSMKDQTCGNIGRGTTSNKAEYHGLIAGLRLAGKHVPPGTSLTVMGDSKLVISQMRQEWKVLDEGIRSLWEEAQTLAASFGSVTYLRIPRDKNRDADALARKALRDRSTQLEAPSGVSTKPSLISAVPMPAVGASAASFLVAAAAGGQGVRVAAAAVLWQGSDELRRFESPVGSGVSIPEVLRRLLERVRAAIAEIKPQGARVTLLSREEALIKMPPDFGQSTLEVRRPVGAEEALLQRVKGLARQATRA